jgi:hypothetical protein
MRRALVVLAERGVIAEAETRKQVYRRFEDEREPDLNNHAGRDLIPAIFGKDSIAGVSAL